MASDSVSGTVPFHQYHPIKNFVQLPPQVLEKILRHFSYHKIASLRQVCHKVDMVCQKILNSSFMQLQKQAFQAFSDIKADMPRRISERRNHYLIYEYDLMEIISMRLVLLQMTLGKHIESQHCCFFPGKILDEVTYTLDYLNSINIVSFPFWLTNELHDLTVMATEYFKDSIEPGLPKIPYVNNDFFVFNIANNSGTVNYYLPEFFLQGFNTSWESPIYGSKESPGSTNQYKLEPNIGLRKRRRFKRIFPTLHRNMRKANKKIVDQQKQLLVLSSRMIEYDKKNGDMIHKYNSSIQELNKLLTELQYQRSRNEPISLQDEPKSLAASSNDSFPTPGEPNLIKTISPEVVDLMAKQTLRQNYEFCEEDAVNELAKPTLSEVPSPKHDDNSSSSIACTSQPLKLSVTPVTSVSGQQKDLKQPTTDDYLGAQPDPLKLSGLKSSDLWDETICDVWRSNMKEQVENIKCLVINDKCKGVVVSCLPLHIFTPSSLAQTKSQEYSYAEVRFTVDMGDAVQVALTLFNGEGNLSRSIDCPYNTWQFNLRLKSTIWNTQSSEDLNYIMYRGFSLEKHQSDEAIDRDDFAAMLHEVGLLEPDSKIKWFTFEGGLDIGYLSKILTNQCLPDKYALLVDFMKNYLYEVYDVKLIFRKICSITSCLAKSKNIPEGESELMHYAINAGLKNLSSCNKAGVRSKLIAHLITMSDVLILLGWENSWNNFNYEILQQNQNLNMYAD